MEDLNKPTRSKASGTESSSEAEADGGTLHKGKSKKHKRAGGKTSSKSKSSDESAPSSDKGGAESGGAQGK